MATAGKCPLCTTSAKPCSSCVFFKEIKKPPAYSPSFPTVPSSRASLYDHFQQSKSALQTNLIRIDIFLEEFSANIQSHIVTAQRYQDHVTKRLLDWKSDLEREIALSLHEFESVLKGESTVEGLQSMFAVPLLCTNEDLVCFTYEPNASTDLASIFSATFTPPQPPEIAVSKLHSTALSTQSSAHILPLVSSTHIAYFDFRTQQLGPPTPLRESIDLTATGTWIAIDENQVFVCLGYRYSYGCEGSAKVVDRWGSVKACPMLHYPHPECGILVWQSAVFLFGGSAFGNRSERMSLSCSYWKELPLMREWRQHFTPVEWHNAIYLCGGIGNRTIEVFDSVSFRTLYIYVPYRTQSVCVAQGEELVIYSSVDRLVLTHTGLGVVVRGKQGSADIEEWNTPPVFAGQRLIFSGFKGVKFTSVVDTEEELALFQDFS